MNYFPNDDTCAILVFAKSTVCESNSKKILDSTEANQKLWETLNQKVVKISQKSKIPFFIADESVQTGKTFGEKISNSIQTIFEKGFEKVIVIGNDCPELKVNHLLSAKVALQNNDFIFGPDYSGGSYLIGISKNQFHKSEFQSFNWQTKNLHKNLVSFYADANIFLLPYLNDVNTTFSFKKAVHQLHFTDYLKNILLDLLYHFKYVIYYIENTISQKIPLFLNYRGPPSFVLKTN